MPLTPEPGAAHPPRGLAAPSLLVRAASFAGALTLLAALGDGALARLPSWTSVASSDALDASASATLHAASAEAGADLAVASVAASGSDAGPRDLVDSDVVDLNAANADDLARLPRVGPKRARAILDLRARMGGFRRLEDLLRVRGIGRSTLAHLRGRTRVVAPDAGPR